MCISLLDVTSKSFTKLSEAATNMIKTTALLNTAFCIYTFPCAIWHQLHIVGLEGFTMTSSFYHYSVILMFCNCCINPFLYTFEYREFQDAAKKLLCRCKHAQNVNVTNITSVSTSVSSVA